LADERRQAQRLPRLLELSFQWEGEQHTGMTVQLSMTGAFVNTTVFPKIGERMDLVFRAHPGHPDIIFEGRVVRVIDQYSGNSVVPGMALEWRRLRTAGPPGYLARVLSTLFEHDVLVGSGKSGASWTPGPVIASRQADHQRDTDTLNTTISLPRALSEQFGERRKVPRVLCDVKALLLLNRLPVSGRLKDISPRGLRIQCDADFLNNGDVVTGRFPIPSREGHRLIRVTGVIVRLADHPEPPGFAAEIIGVGSQEDADALRRLFERM
jgi:hypothetical protein